MTLRTVGRNSLFGELVVMIIDMAIFTFTEYQGVRKFCSMTYIASNFQMLPFQFEVSFTVIKILNPFDNAERLLAMTLYAILAELVVMHILMAGSAVIKLNPFKFLVLLLVFKYCFMTTDARYFLVFS